MPTHLSCDWSTLFMHVILLRLSLVRTSLQYSTGVQRLDNSMYSTTTNVQDVEQQHIADNVGMELISDASDTIARGNK